MTHADDADVSLGLDAFARSVAGPPWILGHRGCPLDAPENTLAGLRLALAAGLDGCAYDVRACATGEAVLMADERLERTTDGAGPVAERTLPELFHLDAGGWFEKRFAGEPVPLVDEVLEALGESFREALHWIELRDAESLPAVLERLAERARGLPVRLASRSRTLCLEVRDAGHPAVWIGDEAGTDALRFVRDERLAGFATTASGWSAAPAGLEWPCERWGLRYDAPGALVSALRAGLFGFTTSEPARALGLRALAHLAPGLERPPLVAPPLEVEPGGLRGPSGGRLDLARARGGEWSGRWHPRVALENPLPFAVRARLGLRVRRGAFEIQGLPVELELRPREARALDASVVGGSWSPGGDPVVLALLEWDAGAGRRAGTLLVEAPLVRLRSLRLEGVSRRLVLLRENPLDLEATMIARRHGRDLLVSIENPGELEDPHVVVRVQDRTFRGGAGLRVRLPEPASWGPEGLPFSCGIEGRVERAGRTYARLRRWAGGLPQDADSGEPGRLLLGTGS